MIDFIEMEFANFLSYGDTIFKYSFNVNTITQIKGVSGVGKSALIETVWYNLTGKPYRDIKIEELQNDLTGKPLYTKLTFSKNSDIYIIERDFEKFIMLKNNEIVPLLSRKNYQEVLYKDILEIDNEDYLELVLFKSKIKPISFLTMKKADRISFIESLFNIDILSVIDDDLTNDIKQYKNNLSIVESNISQQISFKEKIIIQIEQTKKMLESARTEQIDKIQIDIKTEQEQLIRCNKALEVVDKIIQVNNQLRNEIKQKQLLLNSNNDNINNIKNTIKFNSEKLALFRNSCPECVKIPEMKEIAQNHSLNQQIEAILNHTKTISNEIQLLQQKLNNNIEKENKKIAIDRQYKISNENIIKLNSELNKINNQTVKIPETNVLDEIEIELEKYNNNKDSIIFDKNISEYLKKLLVQMKIFIMKRRLVYFNLKVNEYLQKFKLNYSLIFDEKFDIKIHRFGTKKSKNFYSLSEGEKMRFNLSVMFSIIELSKELNKQDFNVLFCDEIFDSLDAFNVDIIFNILKEINSNKEIIFINHNDSNLNHSLIDKKIIVEKINNFSIWN